jgi:hypothetical protein
MSVTAPVVAGLANADATTRERIRTEVLDLARQSIRDGTVRMLSTATVIVAHVSVQDDSAFQQWMPWPRFVASNIAGGVLWTSAFGFGAYLLGGQIHRFSGPFDCLAVGLATVAVVWAILTFRRHERRLIAQAELAYPGSVT